MAEYKDERKEGALLLAALLHSRLFDLAEDAIVGEIKESGIRSASFKISTPEDGQYTVWVSPSAYPPRETKNHVS
jgi:hypothetical protein